MPDLHLNPQATRRPWSIRHWTAMIVGGLISLVVLWYAIVITGLTAFNWSGTRTRTILRFTPLPAAVVQWHPLAYTEFFEQRAAVMQYSSFLASTTSGLYQAQNLAEAGATAASTMIRAQATIDALQSYGVTYTQADIDQAYQAQLSQIGNPDQVASTIKQLYGWTPEQFKKYVIATNVLRDKLQEKLSFDDSISGNAKQQAEKVLALAQAKDASFSDLAKQYSDDTYGASGGDLGWVTKGEQAQEIDDVAFSLDLNTVSGLVHTQYGYHILKVTEKRTQDGVNQVHLFQITILAPQVDDILTSRLQKERVLLLVPGLHWDAQHGRVTS